MTIKSYKHTKGEIMNGETKNSEAQIKGCTTFANFECDKGTNSIIGVNPIGSDLFFNKIDVLNEVCSVGKRCYIILEDKLKEVHSAYIEEVNRLNDEPQIESIPDYYIKKYRLNDSFINHFLPATIIKNANIQDDILKITLNYCEQNGFPIVDDQNSDYIEGNEPQEYFFFDVQPFVALSILIYITFEVQNNVRAILDFTSSKEIKGQTISSIFGKNNFYYINEYLDNIYQFAWLFDIDSNDKYELSLVEISEKLINLINRIQQTTTYLQYKTENIFNSEYKKFSVLEIHTNIMSIAWEQLKLAMFPYANGIVKKCKSCGRIFEADSNSTSYCSEKCKSKSKNVNSNNSYNKLRNFHTELCKLYNTVDKSLFSSLDKEIQENIIKYASLDISSLKKVKDENKIKNLERYIEILDKFDRIKN